MMCLRHVPPPSAQHDVLQPSSWWSMSHASAWTYLLPTMPHSSSAVDKVVTMMSQTKTKNADAADHHHHDVTVNASMDSLLTASAAAAAAHHHHHQQTSHASSDGVDGSMLSQSSGICTRYSMRTQRGEEAEPRRGKRSASAPPAQRVRRSLETLMPIPDEMMSEDAVRGAAATSSRSYHMETAASSSSSSPSSSSSSLASSKWASKTLAAFMLEQQQQQGLSSGSGAGASPPVRRLRGAGSSPRHSVNTSENIFPSAAAAPA